VVWLAVFVCAAAAQTSYDLTLRLDFDNRAWAGAERVRWTNAGAAGENALLFQLYANSPEEAGPRLEVTAVKAANGAALPFVVENGGGWLRVPLREAVPAGGSVEIALEFKGVVPEIDAEETTLLAHVMQQVGAVLNDLRETRSPRETNFRARGVMFLGAGFPLLAAREDGKWLRAGDAGMARATNADTANYAVTIETAPDIKVHTAGAPAATDKADCEFGAVRYRFAAQNLRDFTIVAGRELSVLTEPAGEVAVRSVFAPSHEANGRRVLKIAADAARIFQARFGPLPLKQITVVEAPLVAGLGSAEFSGGGAIAGAFYVDFDSPTMRALPDMIRSQRGAMEDSLEWTVARTVAQQWWGAAVGGDAAREPLLTETLANWSALLYCAEMHGPEHAARAADEQLRGVYKIYRTFGGRDREANHPAHFYRNSFQYSALVAGKGALWLQAVHKLLGDEKLFAALRGFYQAFQLRRAAFDDLRDALQAQATPAQQKTLARLTSRWLRERRGDEDIAPPDPQLADALGLPPPVATRRDKGNRFARLGKFFWQQMTRIK
jgi:hypothetical protein